jgi:glycosyltransferase 2 family protein
VSAPLDSWAATLRRRDLSALAGALISLVSLAAVAWWISGQESPELPDSAAGYAWLALAALVVASNFGLRGLRWHRIMVHAGIEHRLRDALGLTLVGYMGNNVLPARGGELLKIGLLGARSSARRREILGTVIAERLLDAAVLVVLFVALTWAGVAGAPGGRGEAALAAGGLVACAAAVALYVRLRRGGRFERFAATVRPVARASRLLTRRQGIPLALLSLAIWCIDAVAFMLIARSIGVALSLPDASVVVVLAALGAAIPAAPGYVGTFDAGMLLGLSAAGVEGGAAVGVLLLTRFLFFVPVTIAGLAVLVCGYGGLRRRRSVSTSWNGSASSKSVSSSSNMPDQRSRT